jgi:hypothetical protein
MHHLAWLARKRNVGFWPLEPALKKAANAITYATEQEKTING